MLRNGRLSYLALVKDLRHWADNAGGARAKHLLHAVLLQGCGQVAHGEVPLRHLKFTLFATQTHTMRHISKEKACGEMPCSATFLDILTEAG